MQTVRGLHHVTAISGPAQENLDFYAGVLGMRLVKRSVNQDDPGTYHLFYADAEGHPGTDLTFFPWAQMAPSRPGHGLSTEVSLAVPPGSLSFWEMRLEEKGVRKIARESRFAREVLTFIDPHGMSVALVANEEAMTRPFARWEGSPIPTEQQIRGLESARMVVRDLAPTAQFLVNAMGFRLLGSENGWERYGVESARSGHYLDVGESPNDNRGAWGTGSIHHLAWRVDDEAHQLEVRELVWNGGARPTPVIDRFWFKSVYFLSPGGVLFELATDGPGFAVDEDRARLGESLVLPPWLESDRGTIEAALPKLSPPEN
ncbi:MAG TPA: ring-cleaving dioxygenase [Chthoniobacterales bacterium]|nr:ring-cleaving dioxygenase [Chthoniobacterales bacterium]